MMTSNPWQNQFNYPNSLTTPIQQQYQSGMVNAPNEAYAFNYPVAPGNSVIFKDESLPFVYVKTMGMSQYDTPIFDKYRKVEENASGTQSAQETQQEYVHKSDFEKLKAEFFDFKNDMNKVFNSPTIQIKTEGN